MSNMIAALVLAGLMALAPSPKGQLSGEQILSTSSGVEQVEELPWVLTAGTGRPGAGGCQHSIITARLSGLRPGRHYSVVHPDDPTAPTPFVDPLPVTPLIADGTGRATVVSFGWADSALPCRTTWSLLDTGSDRVDRWVRQNTPYTIVYQHATPMVRTPLGELCTTSSACRAVLTSHDGQTVLVQQADGNVVLRHSGRAAWNTGTAGHPDAFAMLQTDGNLVVRSSSGTALYATETGRNVGSPHYRDDQYWNRRLVVEDDGNLVLRVSLTSQAVWNSGTVRR